MYKETIYLISWFSKEFKIYNLNNSLWNWSIIILIHNSIFTNFVIDDQSIMKREDFLNSKCIKFIVII